jgi:hypothetical protein
MSMVWKSVKCGGESVTSSTDEFQVACARHLRDLAANITIIGATSVLHNPFIFVQPQSVIIYSCSKSLISCFYRPACRR